MIAIQHIDFDTLCPYCGAPLTLPPTRDYRDHVGPVTVDMGVPEVPHCPRGCGPEEDYVPRWPAVIPF